MIVQIIKLKTSLPKEDLLEKARKRAPQFEAISGLLQKYYVKLEDGRYGGVYIWDSEESLAAFRSSELASTIAEAYQLTEAPQIEIMDVLFELRK